MDPLLSSYRFAAEQNIASMDDPRILKFREKELRKLLRGSNKIRNKRRNRKKSERLKRAEKVFASMKADYRWQNECIETKVSAFLATDERRNVLINLLKS